MINKKGLTDEQIQLLIDAKIKVDQATMLGDKFGVNKIVLHLIVDSMKKDMVNI